MILAGALLLDQFIGDTAGMATQQKINPDRRTMSMRR
jgi:hypothetical protein